MSTIHSRPSVFVSSTISDFRDLRSSLKYWLEESGLEVRLSEYNDMQKSPGIGTFEACFESIRSADFYLLLIGDRRGSLYDAPQGVSVTQKEYRVAYEAFSTESRRPIPLLFVRCWVRERLDGWGRTASHEPPFGDAAFVRDFIAEVTKDQETNSAVQGVGPYPLANWLHPFRDFADIIDALKVALSLRTDISIQKQLAALRLDLEHAISLFVGKHKYRFSKDDPARQQVESWITDLGGDPEKVREVLDNLAVDVPFPGHFLLDTVVKKHPVHVKGNSPLTLDREDTVRLTMYVIGGIAPVPEMNSVTSTLTSGSFLAYNPSQRRFEDSELNDSVSDLWTEIQGYSGLYQAAKKTVETLYPELVFANRRRLPSFSIAWEDAALIWAVYHRQVNLYRRISSLYAYLLGTKEHPSPDSLLPSTPFGKAEEDKIRQERATKNEIRKWFKVSGWWDV